MNKEIDINKFNKSITFQNRGIGFTQIGIAGEILDLIDDLQQENKQLKDNWNDLKKYIIKNIIYDDVGMKILDPSPLEDYMQELEKGKDE